MSESPHAEAIGTGGADGGRVPAPPGALASFARFVLCGGGVSLVASAAVPTVAEVLPWTVANALITVVSTLLCTELHSLITFRTGRRAGWRRHLQSAGSATASYAVTTAAVLVLHALQPTAGRLLEQAVYLGAAGLAGIGRFLVLRLLVFADDRDTDAVRPRPARGQRTPALRHPHDARARVPARRPVPAQLRHAPARV
ncbi:GtrA family protein [Streptomyces sp. HUAS ZL42]|uniref:GtrA family protein n=1 Tax=Streptomyces sp. HUAS ZL42 TaxID=3231715 RepID=UPI00345EEFCB